MREELGGSARVAFKVFVAIVVLAAAQIAWWIVFLVRVAAEQRHVLMIVSEASVFIALMVLGVGIIYRTLSEQVRLKHLRATFLSAVTHELRSPLASIRLLLETIERGRVQDEAKKKDLLKKVLLDVDRLEDLVVALLRAGQLEGGALRIDRAPTDLGGLAREAAARARPRLFGPDDVLEVDAADDVRVLADRGLLEGAVANLLENAAKYSKSPRRVRLTVVRIQGEARLEVRDEGIGLDAETRANLFRPFYRAGDEETRRAPGTGLGLYLVHGIVSAHGGRCEAESAGPGRGTTIRLHLPLARDGGAPADEEAGS